MGFSWIVMTLLVLMTTSPSLPEHLSSCSSEDNICHCNNITPEDFDFLRNFTEKETCAQFMLQNSTLKIIQADAFLGMINVQEYYLNNTGLVDIQAAAFSSPKIEILNLTGNRLSHVARGWFNSLYGLEYLYLNLNQIDIIEEESFHGLRSLLCLNLSNNKLRILPGNLLSNLNKLERFDISGNSLKSIDFKMNNFHQLKVLNFSKNSLESISDCSSNTTDIKNESVIVRKSCFPQSLQTADFGRNVISRIADNSFENLKNLKYLALDNNRISEIPFKLLASLESLNHLSINGNQIRQFKVGVFSGVPNIEYLSIASLQLKELDARIFVPVNHLKALDISSNNLVSLNDQIFEFCPELQSINIQGNEFSCSTVASIIIKSRAQNFSILCSKHYHSENVIGIPCIAEMQPSNLPNHENVDMKEQMLVYLSGASCVILSTMLLFKLRQYYTRRDRERRNHPTSILTI